MHMIVAADGSGHFTSIQEAVNQIPDDRSEGAVIFVKNGIYKEKLHIQKSFVRLVGESREHTIVTYDDLHCWMGEHIRLEGWENWNKPESEQTVSYFEYNSRGPGAAAAGSRVAWSRILTAEEAEAYTLNHIFAGDDGWNPAG